MPEESPPPPGATPEPAPAPEPEKKGRSRRGSVKVDEASPPARKRTKSESEELPAETAEERRHRLKCDLVAHAWGIQKQKWSFVAGHSAVGLLLLFCLGLILAKVVRQGVTDEDASWLRAAVSSIVTSFMAYMFGKAQAEPKS